MRRRFVAPAQAVDGDTARAKLAAMEVEADDIEFEPRVGRIGRDRGSNLRRMRAAVRVATWAVKGAPRSGRTGMRAHFAKGSSAKARVSAPAQRRVVVKARYVAHGSGRSATLRAHVAYLAREAREQGRSAVDGATKKRSDDLNRTVDYLARETGPDRGGYSFYNQQESGLNAKEVTSGWSNDARHFRLIISAEDGAALGDLRPFVREVLEGLESKLGTRLTWLAVDHHDTDNPHTHVLIRGRRADDQDLFIPSKLIASGIREHAQEVATRVLGPRQDLDLVRERARDIATLGVAQLDRELLARRGPDGVVRAERSDLIARLDRLEGRGLARRVENGWRLADDLGLNLRALAERAEIERAIAPVRRRGEPLLAADPGAPVLGQLVHLGPADEFGDGFLAVIETGRGELRYARFERADDLAALDGATPGAVVAFEPMVARTRQSDEAVARVAARSGGVYSASHHAAVQPSVDAGLVSANIRRLEAMRRSGLVARRADGAFEITGDHLAKALAFEERQIRHSPLTASVASYWTLAEQVDAPGLTHLDRVLAGERESLSGAGALMREFAAALQQRRLFLIEQGWMGPDDRMLSRSMIQQLGTLELHDRAQRLSHDLGLPVLTQTPQQVRGVYARRIDLAQGRVALILQDRQAFLVPWRPALERFAGRAVEAVMRGQTLSWGLARAGPSLPPM